MGKVLYSIFLLIIATLLYSDPLHAAKRKGPRIDREGFGQPTYDKNWHRTHRYKPKNVQNSQRDLRTGENAKFFERLNPPAQPSPPPIEVIEIKGELP